MPTYCGMNRILRDVGMGAIATMRRSTVLRSLGLYGRRANSILCGVLSALVALPYLRDRLLSNTGSHSPLAVSPKPWLSSPQSWKVHKESHSIIGSFGLIDKTVGDDRYVALYDISIEPAATTFPSMIRRIPRLRSWVDVDSYGKCAFGY